MKRKLLFIGFLLVMLSSSCFLFEVDYDYLIYIPKEKPDSGEYPLLLFLHGRGESGTNLELVKKHGPPSFLNENSDFPFLTVSPQCSNEKVWEPKPLLRLIRDIEVRYPIDKNRIYITGLSMGGYGTWDLAQTAPDRFAAIAPVCGGSSLSLSKIDVLKDMPIWAFHGAKDEIVPPSETIQLVERLESVGGNVRFTLYPDADHDSWTETYNNQELYDWLLSHTKNDSK